MRILNNPPFMVLRCWPGWLTELHEETHLCRSHQTCWWPVEFVISSFCLLHTPKFGSAEIPVSGGQRRRLSPWRRFLTGTVGREPSTRWRAWPDTLQNPVRTNRGFRLQKLRPLESRRHLLYLSVAQEAEVRRRHPQPHADTGQLGHFTVGHGVGRDGWCWWRQHRRAPLRGIHFCSCKHQTWWTALIE